MQRVSALILMAAAAFAQPHGRLPEYALVLEDPPVAQKVQSRAALQSATAQAHLQKVRRAQNSVLAQLAARKIPVSATSQLLVNAIFVRVAHQDAPALQSIPGVKWIQYQPTSRPALAAAEDLIHVPAAWSAIGGNANAGAGVRIAVIDTGIDQTHPGFKDTGFTAPAGFPAGDTAFTNNKVIVARSYVSMQIDSDPTYSTPDDVSPRDRQGHGTAIAMIAAGVQNTSPLGSITGVAPKAYLGNYKVFGSPGVNEYTTRSSWIAALTDAVKDGMNIATLSLGEGDSAFYGALDKGKDLCGDDVACDVGAQAVENATSLGLLVVAAAGNNGDLGKNGITKLSMNSPGTAPSALTVGASNNSHQVYQSLRAGGTSFGAHGLFADGPRPASPLTASTKDVTSLGNDGLACAALPSGSLNGSIALVQRGTCTFADKVNNAQAAGAVAVIFYQSEGLEDYTLRLYVQNTAIPAFLIGNSDGKALKSFLSGNPTASVTLDPAYAFADNPAVNTVAAWSSRGPSIGNFASTRDYGLKPELVALGTHIYTATQSYDPNSDSYNATGYTAANGSSYAVAFAAGVAAMAKARIPNLNTPGRLKSAVVNTATADLLGGAHVLDAGAGKLNAADAVAVAATLEPAAIGFGPVATLPISRNIVITNVSASAATFTLTVRQITSDNSARVTVSPSSVTLQPGATSSAISVALTGTRPAGGNYEGFIDVKGAGPDLHLPYSYVVGDGIPYDIIPTRNGSFTGIPNDFGWLLLFRVMDRYGVPVANTPVSFRVVSGGGKFDSAGGDKASDLLGNAGVFVDLGPQQGDQIFEGTAGGLVQRFEGFARRLPAIKANGVVNAATFAVGQGMQPGSYISIFGSDLADDTQVETTVPLPVSLGQVSVSFDGGGLSLPGRFHFISPSQINVQIPWEFAGQSSVKMKVTLYGYLWGAVYDVPLSTYSPGIFAVTDGANNQVINAGNPAKRGGSIVIYANGLGPVSVPQTSGGAASSTQLVGVSTPPTVTIGGAQGGVIFGGLTPGSVALYQVNVSIPTNAPTGTQPLKLSVGGQDVTVSVAVQ